MACTGEGSSTAPSATATKQLRAQDLLPDLTSLKFAKTQSERDPAAQPGQDAYRALYQQNAAPQMSARVDVTVQADAPAAGAQFTQLAAAIKNAPADLFGGTSTQKDWTPTALGDQRAAVVTAKPDANGTLVWTDIYRFGRVIAVVQVLSRNEAEATAARNGIAEKIRALATQ